MASAGGEASGVQVFVGAEELVDVVGVVVEVVLEVEVELEIELEVEVEVEVIVEVEDDEVEVKVEVLEVEVEELEVVLKVEVELEIELVVVTRAPQLKQLKSKKSSSPVSPLSCEGPLSKTQTVGDASLKPKEPQPAKLKQALAQPSRSSPSNTVKGFPEGVNPD